MKFKAKENVNVRSEPSLGSTKILTIPKGTIIESDEYVWKTIMLPSGTKGFCVADYLESIPETVDVNLPEFFIGKKNLASDSNTIKVRKIINDEFNLSASNYHLNCTEYVMYRVKTKLGIKIQWPVKFGRNGGEWANIFENHKSYRVLAEPRTNCAISLTEVRRKNGTLTAEGHVAFVEEVLPNGAIKISEANWPGEGIYNERILTLKDWKDKYKSKFISFT